MRGQKMFIVMENIIFLVICWMVLVLNNDVVAIENIKLSEKVTCDVPPPVIDFTLDVHPFDIFLTWDALPPNGCEIKYAVYVDDEKKIEIPENSFNITGLNACTDYTIGVSAFYNLIEGEITTKSQKTPVPEPFSIYSIDSPTVEDGVDIIKIVWSMDLIVKNCVNYYLLYYWNQFGDTWSNTTTNMWYEINSVVGCMNYSVQIRPEISAALPGNDRIIDQSVTARPMNPPDCRVQISEKTSVKVICKTDSFTVNMCEIESITLTCQAPAETNGRFPWIIQPPPKVQTITDSQTRPDIIVTVYGLSEFTNYTCTGMLRNSGGPSVDSEEISFQTLEEVPSNPVDLTIIAMSSESFAIGWTEPNKVPGVLTNYRVLLENKGPQHHVGEQCLNLTGAKHLLDAQTYSYSLKVFPYYQYVVSVNGLDGAGHGEKATLELTTDPGIPEAPINLDYTPYVDLSSELYNVTVQIDWQLPCNTNGPLKGFSLNIAWNHTQNASLSGSRTEFVVKNVDITNIDYTYNITDIQELSNYEVAITTVLDNDTESEPAKISFSSPEGVPGPSKKKITHVRRHLGFS